MPLVKYGADYLSFVPSSELYMTDFIDQHSGKAYDVLPITPNTWHIFFYYHTLNHNSSITTLSPYPEDYSTALELGKDTLDYMLPRIQDWTYSHPNQLVVSFGYLGSVFVLHEGDKKYLPGVEAYMKLHHNLVSYSGQAKTYIVVP
jgi:hypothetical protein